jgi:hypothetical protein
MIRTLILTFHKHLESTPNPTPLPSARLHCTFVHVGEYARVVHALLWAHLQPHLMRPWESFAFSTHMLRLISPFCWWLPSWDKGYFRSKGICFCLGSFTTSFFCGPLGMVYELQWDFFVPYDSMSGFDLFFKVCGHIVQSHVPLSVSRLLSTFWVLVLEKQCRAIHPIAINEVTCRLVAHTLAI